MQAGLGAVVTRRIAAALADWDAEARLHLSGKREVASCKCRLIDRRYMQACTLQANACGDTLPSAGQRSAMTCWALSSGSYVQADAGLL